MRARFLSGHFIRTLLTQMLVVLFLIIAEAVIILYSMWRMDRDWPRFVAYDYVNAVVEDFAVMEDPTIEKIMDTFTERMDKRISGLLVRNVSDGSMFIYGRLPAEEGDGENNELRRIEEDQDFRTFKKDSPVYSISVTLEGEGLSPQVTVLGEDSYSSVRYMVPDFINRRDVAATVFFFIDDEMIASFDLLVVNMRTFESTGFVISTSILTLVWMVPICLILSLVISLIVSRRSTRELEELQNGLASIAHGFLGIQLKAQKSYELDQIARSIKELDSELQKNRLARREWIRSIAHDLNTPLTSINLLVEGLSDGIYQPDEAFMKSLRKEIAALTSRVETVRYYAGLLDPDLKLHSGASDLAEALEDALSHYDRSLYDLEVVDSAKVELDPLYFGRAVRELVDNAVNASGGEKIAITVKANSLEVRNSGALPKDHPDLFEPWARGDRSRHSGGSGLGLPIVGQIMTLHDARVVISEEGGQVVVRLVFRASQT